MLNRWALRRWGLALPLVAALIGFGHAAVERGLADWTAWKARADVRLWSQRQKKPKQDDWEAAIAALRAALAMRSDNPALHEAIGMAYSLERYVTGAPGGWTKYEELAPSHYRRATELRPASPYAWAGLAQSKVRRLQLDEEAFRALDLAMRYGPWEPPVQVAVSEIGMLWWSALGDERQGRMREWWQRTALRQSESLVRIARTHRRESLLCREGIRLEGNPLKC